MEILTSIQLAHSEKKLTQTEHLSNILKYLLVCNGLTQNELARSLEISKFKMCRLINRNSSVDLTLWERICSLYNINFDAIKTGLITTHCKNESGIIAELAPNIQYPLTFGPVVRMHIMIFKSLWGEKYFEEFCWANKIDPILFVNENNPADLNLSLRLIQHSILKGKIKKPDDLKVYAFHAYNFEQNFGKYRYLFNHLNGISKLKEILENLCSKYEQNHTYTIEDISYNNKWLEMSFYPNEHANLTLYKNDPILGNSYEIFVHQYFLEILGKKGIIEKKESVFTGDKKCTLRITEV